MSSLLGKCHRRRHRHRRPPAFTHTHVSTRARSRAPARTHKRGGRGSREKVAACVGACRRVVQASAQTPSPPPPTAPPIPESAVRSAVGAYLEGALGKGDSEGRVGHLRGKRGHIRRHEVNQRLPLKARAADASNGVVDRLWREIADLHDARDLIRGRRGLWCRHTSESKRPLEQAQRRHQGDGRLPRARGGERPPIGGG